MQIVSLHLIHKYVIIFMFIGWNQFILFNYALKRLCNKFSGKKQQKQKVKKQRNT